MYKFNFFMNMKRIILLFSVVVSTTLFAANPDVYVLTDANASISNDSTHFNTWGYFLADHMLPSVFISSRAYEAFTLKSFMDVEAGLQWLQKLPARTVVFLQVGRYDMRISDYLANTNHHSYTNRLQAVADCCKRNKIQLVLCTPIALPKYKNNSYVDDIGGYDDVMHNVADYYQIPLLDLFSLTHEWIAGLDTDSIATYYEMDSPTLPLTEQGARQVAEIAAKQIGGIKKLAKLTK